MQKQTYILGIESSCDDTSVAVIKDGILLSNVTAGQAVHEKYGGVVPELASRAHQVNIIPTVDIALKQAGICPKQVTAVAFTQGPGLLGSLLVGSSFAKGFALAHDIPLVSVNHLQGHISALFIQEKEVEKVLPTFPFLTLLVSGGHTQIILVEDFFTQKILGETIDDAAGEAFDKCAKVIGLGYPGGPVVDKLAKLGNPKAYKFTRPKTSAFDFSFSGLKTAFLYFIRDNMNANPNFVSENKEDICAALQFTIIDILLTKLENAVKSTGVHEIAIAGGVSANSGLRTALLQKGKLMGWNVHIPDLRFTTDNAAMIAITGYHKYLKKEFVSQEVTPNSRLKL